MCSLSLRWWRRRVWVGCWSAWWRVRAQTSSWRGRSWCWSTSRNWEPSNCSWRSHGSTDAHVTHKHTNTGDLEGRESFSELRHERWEARMKRWSSEFSGGGGGMGSGEERTGSEWCGGEKVPTAVTGNKMWRKTWEGLLWIFVLTSDPSLRSH